jgi:hypothetical protein
MTATPSSMGLRIVAGADQKRREFARQKAQLRGAIVHDRQLTPAARLIGYEIADHLNYQTGDAWPSQKFLAIRTGYSEKTVERATKELDGWFAREIDGNGYRYVPKFDKLAKSNTRKDVGRSSTFPKKSADIRERNIRQNVGLSSLGDPIREPGCADGDGKHSRSPRSHGRKAERNGENPIAFAGHDQEITAAATSGGAPRFVFEHSEPWRAWNEYRERMGLGPLPTRQHMVAGRWRTGWDVSTLWPPGYGRIKPRRKL